MKTRHLLSLTLLLFAIGSIGCSNPGNTITTQGSGSSTLTGNVASYSADGLRVLDSSGVLVTLSGTTFSTTTNHNGIFTITGIPYGVYNIVFSKPGFDSMTYPEHHLLGEGTDDFVDPYLIQNSTDSIVFDQVSVSVGDTILEGFDTTQRLTTEVRMHLAGTDSISSLLFNISASTDTGLALLRDVQPTYITSTHIRSESYLSHQAPYKALRTGDTVLFTTMIAFDPNITRGRPTPQYARSQTGKKVITWRYYYVLP